MLPEHQNIGNEGFKIYLHHKITVNVVAIYSDKS